MILSNWRNRLGRVASRSRNVGDDLAELIEEFLIESTHWKNPRSAEIRDAGGALWSVRDEWLEGLMSDDDATIWVDAARRILYDTQRERSRRNHPAGKGRT